MQKIFLRLRLEGCEVLEIDPDAIRGFRIEYSDKDHAYMLTASNDSQAYILQIGNFDTCHHLLNKIHAILDIQIRDI